MTSAASSVSDHTRDVARRSTTRRPCACGDRSVSDTESVELDADHFRAMHELFGQPIVLPAGSDELQSIDEAFVLFGYLLRLDSNARCPENRRDFLEARVSPETNGAVHDTAKRQHPPLEPAERGQDERDEKRGCDRLGAMSGADRQPDRRDDPDRCRSRESDDFATRLHDRARAQKAYARYDLCGDARRIADATFTIRHPDGNGQVHEERGPKADENVCPESGGLARELALDADDAAEQHGEGQAPKQVERKRLQPRHRLQQAHR